MKLICLNIFQKVSLLFLVISCAMAPLKEQTRKNFSEYQSSSQVTSYFLSGIPDWANTSYSGRCKRKTSKKQLNLVNVMNSFAFDYRQAVNLQHSYNVRLQELQSGELQRFISAKDEERVFVETMGQIKENISVLKTPAFKRLHVIWIDPVLKSKQSLARLKKFFNSEAGGKGYPIFASLCLSHSEMEEFANSHGFNAYGVRFIPYEMFSPYNNVGQLDYFLQLNFPLIFPGKDLHFYLIDAKKPLGFIGSTNIHKI